jgi:hypothetical protein
MGEPVFAGCAITVASWREMLCVDEADKAAARVASKLGSPGRDHLGYRVARTPSVEWIA